MHQDDELDFGEDELVPQTALAAAAASLDASRLDRSISASGPSNGVGWAAGTSKNGLEGNAGASAAARGADAVGGAGVSSSQLAPPPAAVSAGSTPPVPAKKGHDETLDALGNKLPAGWVSRVSKSTGNVYYRNTLLNTSAWDIPSEPAMGKKPPPPPSAAQDDPAPVLAVDQAAPPPAASAAPVPVTEEQAPTPVAQQQAAQDVQMQDPPAAAQEAAKPRVFVHPDRIGFADPAAAPPQPSAASPPTGPAATRGNTMYPPRRASTAAQDLSASTSAAAPAPPTGPRAAMDQRRQVLPPQNQIIAPVAPVSRRRGRGRRSLVPETTAANMVPVGTPRGPRASLGEQANASAVATPGADDRWAAPTGRAGAVAAAVNGPRFAVPGAVRPGRDRPPHIAAPASTPTADLVTSSSAVLSGTPMGATSPRSSRRALSTAQEVSAPAAARPPASSEPASPERGRQQSLGAVSATSGLSLAEKLEQQRLARLAATGGPPSALDVPPHVAIRGTAGPSAADDRFAPPGGGAGSAADRFAPRSSRRGKGGGGRSGAAPSALPVGGANATPVGAAGGGWGDRARIAKEKIEREEREAKEREERDAATRENIKRAAEDEERRKRQMEVDEEHKRDRERKAQGDADAREKERRASAYGARAGRGEQRRSRSPERGHRGRSPPPPLRRRSLSPPPRMRDLSPPRGRAPSPLPPRVRMRSRSPPPHMRPRSRSPPLDMHRRGGRSPSPGRLPPIRFPLGVLDKSSSALRGRFRDPDSEAAYDAPLIRTAGPMMPLGDGGRRMPLDDFDTPKRRRARGGRSRRSRGGEGGRDDFPDDRFRDDARRERSVSPRRGERDGEDRARGESRRGERNGADSVPNGVSPLPRPPPSLLSRIGTSSTSLPDKPLVSSSSPAAGSSKRARDPEEVIRAEAERRKRK